MEIKVLNTKIHFELLPESDQPQKTVFQPNMDVLKIGKVLDIGHKVEKVKKGDFITLHINNISKYIQNDYFCNERDVIFINGYPQEGKVQITEQEDINMTSFKKARVLKSSTNDIKDNEKVFYKDGQFLELPDHTKILSETQIYFSED